VAFDISKGVGPDPIHFPLPLSLPPFHPDHSLLFPSFLIPLPTPPSIPIPFLSPPPLSVQSRPVLSPPLFTTLVPFASFPIPYSLPCIPSLPSSLVPSLLSHPLNPTPLLSSIPFSLPRPPSLFTPALPYSSPPCFAPNALSMATSEHHSFEP